MTMPAYQRLIDAADELNREAGECAPGMIQRQHDRIAAKYGQPRQGFRFEHMLLAAANGCWVGILIMSLV